MTEKKNNVPASAEAPRKKKDGVFGQYFRKSRSTKTAAEIAAEQGLVATRNMVAKFGRAKSLMERSLGYQDAGATSVYLMFQAMNQWARQNHVC